MSRAGGYDAGRARVEYDEYYERSDFRSLPRAERAFVRVMCRSANIPAGARILDIACGTGKYGRAFLDRGMSVIGIDISGVGLRKAHQASDDMRLVQGDISVLPFRNTRFDCILCSGLSVFNEADLDTTVPLVEAFLRVLKPGGILIFVKTTSLTGRYSENRSRFDHTLESFAACFAKAGEPELVKAYLAPPQAFLVLGSYTLNRPVTWASWALSRVFRLPVRAYVTVRRPD